MVRAQPENAFVPGQVEDVVAVLLHVKGFGWRAIPFLRQAGQEGHFGIRKARDGLRTYADIPRMVGWLESRFGYRGRITLLRDDDPLALSLNPEPS